MRRTITTILLALLLSGCAAVGASRRQAYCDSHPYMTDGARERVMAGKIAIGMLAPEVEASWGRPDRINLTLTEGATHEQWVYWFGARPVYVYIVSGRVTAMQD